MIRPLLVAALALVAVGCPPAAPIDTPAQTSPAPPIEPLLQQARAALRQAGISEIRWGLVPYIDADVVNEPYQAIVGHAEARLGVPMSIVVGEDYGAVRQAAVDGSVDIAVLPPYTYVSARAIDDGLYAFATHIAEGSPTYGAYIVVRDDAGVRDVADLRGRSFGFVDPLSTSGWLFPADRLLEAGLHPLRDVRPTFVGAHDDVLDAVIAGELDAGACYSGAIVEARGRNPGASRLRVVAKSRRIPYEAYSARSGFPPIAAEAIGRLLAEISSRTPQGRERLASSLAINGFLPVQDDHYDVVRDVDERVRAAVDPAALSLAATPAPPVDGTPADETP
ncbi:MAG: phosphate/phosphite/phosphonate ABC transporter substrate-binding protein [Proteobacteria bacterium]|nr:phosphate/phosphite/phosphonate ABC transporter substrate-binding protein [Pseudomonadota bacterium]